MLLVRGNSRGGVLIAVRNDRGAGKARFNVATPTHEART